LTVRKAIDARAASLMVLLCMTWGFQQIAIKAVAEDITPLFQIALRSGIAALLVGALMLVRRGRPADPATTATGPTWRPGLLVAILFAAEFLLIGEALRFTTASRTVVFLYTAPIFAALGLQWRLPTERLRVAQWIGIAIAFLGIVLAFWRGAIDSPVSAATGDPAAQNALWGDLLALLSGLAWGSTTVVIRCTNLTNATASKTLLYQLVGAFVLLTIAAVLMGQTGFRHTPLAWSSLLFQGFVVTFASYLAWFWLLQNYIVGRMMVFSFLTPIFGVAFGVLFLNDPLTPSFLFAAACVALGIVLVNLPQKKEGQIP
jgi:drug/metabolite transporter (DMT)-like permease